MTKVCYDITYIIISGIFIFASLKAFYYYVDKQVKVIVNQPQKTNKSIVKVLALGLGSAYVAMLFPQAKETLDFKFYSYTIQLYSITKAIVFLGAIGFGSISGGTILARFKGKTNE